METFSQTPTSSLAGGVVRVQNGRTLLIGSRCTDCKTLAFPRVPVCEKCMSEALADEVMPERGTLYSWTRVHVGPPYVIKPIIVGYVDLTNGIRVFSHLRSADGELEIGAGMKLGLAAVGVDAEGKPVETFVFVPEGRPA